MIPAFIVIGGLGDLVVLSSVARSYESPCFVWIRPDCATIAGAQHLDGFAAWFPLLELNYRKPYADVMSCEPGLFGEPIVIEENYKAAARGGQCVRYFASLAEEQGAPPLSEIKQPSWHVAAWEREAAGSWLDARFNDDSPLVYFGNRANASQRSITPKTFAQLHRGLVSSNLRVVVDHAGPKYTEVAGCNNPIVATTDLTWGVRAAILASASACLSMDTGVLHVAAALGIPTVGVFGPTTHERIASHYPRSRPAPVTKRMSCQGCFWEIPRGYKDRCAEFGCDQLAALDVPETIRQVKKLCGSRSTPSSVTIREALTGASRDQLYGRVPCDTCS